MVAVIDVVHSVPEFTVGLHRPAPAPMFSDLLPGGVSVFQRPDEQDVIVPGVAEFPLDL